DLGMRRGTAGFDGERRAKLQRPERQVVPMAAEVAHRAVAKVPPAIPFRTWKIDFVKRPLRRRTQPQVPIETFGNWHRLLGSLNGENDVLVPLRSFLALPAP